MEVKKVTSGCRRSSESFTVIISASSIWLWWSKRAPGGSVEQIVQIVLAL